MASNIAPYALPASHAAHVDSAGTHLEPAILIILWYMRDASLDDTPSFQIWHTLSSRHSSKSGEAFHLWYTLPNALQLGCSNNIDILMT